MRAHHIALAVLVAAIWGFNFVVVRVGLDAFPPLFLVSIRFAMASLPVLFLPKPAVPWTWMIFIGLVWFAGQFVFLFLGMKAGMPPGLASVSMQTQAFLTLGMAAVALGERPRLRQVIGAGIAGIGLIFIGATATGQVDDMTALGLALVVGAAASWALGNVLLRKVAKSGMLTFVSWVSLVPPLPVLALSWLVEGSAEISHALANVTWLGIGAVIYLAALATNVGMGIWGHLLTKYPAGVVAPFSLLVPVFGVLASALIFGERFGPLRMLGMALILTGLAVTVLPDPRAFMMVRRSTKETHREQAFRQ